MVVAPFEELDENTLVTTVIFADGSEFELKIDVRELIASSVFAENVRERVAKYGPVTVRDIRKRHPVSLRSA